MTDALPWGIEVGFAGTADDVLTGRAGDDAIVWTDITSVVRVTDGVDATRGRTSDQATVSAGSLRFKVNNDDGSFTPGRSDLLAAWIVANMDDPPESIDTNVTLHGSPVRLVSDPTGDDRLVLWTGVVESVESGWTNGIRGAVSVRAVDAVALAGQTVMRAGPVGELMASDPYRRWVYPLDEPAAPCHDIVGQDPDGMTAAPLLAHPIGWPGVVDAELTFTGSSPGSITGEAESTVARFAGADAANGWCLDTRPRPLFDLPDLTPGVAGTTVGLWVAPGSPGRVRSALTVLGSGSSSLTIRVTSTNVPQAVVRDAGLTATLTGSDILLANEWAHLAVVFRRDGSNTDILLMVNGSSVDTATLAAPIQGLGRRQIIVGAGDALTEPWDGQLANVSAHAVDLSGATLARIVNAGQGGEGDTTTARAVRLCYQGRALAPSYPMLPAGASTMSPQHTKGQTLAAALDVAAQAESASWWALPLGPIRMGSRVAYWSAADAVTLPALAVDPDTGFTLDTSEVVNVVTVNRPGGAQTVRRNNDSVAALRNQGQASPVDLHVASDAQAEAYADDIVARYGAPIQRTSTLAVDVLTKQNTVDPADVLAVDIDQVVAVTGLPADAPATSLRFVAIGITDRIGRDSWIRTFNVGRSELLNDVWILGTHELDDTTLLAL